MGSRSSGFNDRSLLRCLTITTIGCAASPTVPADRRSARASSNRACSLPCPLRSWSTRFFEALPRSRMMVGWDRGLSCSAALLALSEAFADVLLDCAFIGSFPLWIGWSAIENSASLRISFDRNTGARAVNGRRRQVVGPGEEAAWDAGRRALSYRIVRKLSPCPPRAARGTTAAAGSRRSSTALGTERQGHAQPQSRPDPPGPRGRAPAGAPGAAAFPPLPAAGGALQSRLVVPRLAGKQADGACKLPLRLAARAAGTAAGSTRGRRRGSAPPAPDPRAARLPGDQGRPAAVPAHRPLLSRALRRAVAAAVPRGRFPRGDGGGRRRARARRPARPLLLELPE